MAGSFQPRKLSAFFCIKNRVRKHFFTRFLCVIDIYIYICNLKCKLHLHENNDIYDKGFQKFPCFYYD